MGTSTRSVRSATRWAALGAAVAVSLGAGGFGIARATSPAGASTFVPITPCRLFDTRPNSTVGDRATPLGENDTFTVTAVGSNGNCDLPSSATGVVLNMTAVDATAATFLTVWPTGEAQPKASALNPTPGEPPAPNAVTTDLSDSGAFSVFNRFGRVHVLADVVGYYTDHNHDDRYYSEAEVDAKLAALESQLAQTAATAAMVRRPVPSGTTITGNASFDGATPGGTTVDYLDIDFPAQMPPLTSADINVAAHTAAAAADVDSTCVGSYFAPKAPPGKICIYIYTAQRVGNVAGWAPESNALNAFRIAYAPLAGQAGQDMYMNAAWAYTAP